MAFVTQTQTVPESWTTTTTTTPGQQITTTSVTGTQNRSGIQTWITTSENTTQTKNLTSSTIPYMRERDVVVLGSGLKPYTNVNVFFRGQNLNGKFTPALTVAYSGTEAITEHFNVKSNVKVIDSSILNMFPSTTASVPVTVGSSSGVVGTAGTTSTTTQTPVTQNVNVQAVDVSAGNMFSTSNDKTFTRKHVWLEVRNTSNMLHCILGVKFITPNDARVHRIIWNTAGNAISVIDDVSTTLKISSISHPPPSNLVGYTSVTSGQLTASKANIYSLVMGTTKNVTFQRQPSTQQTPAAQFPTTTSVIAPVTPAGNIVPVASPVTLTSAVAPIVDLTNIAQSNTNAHNGIDYGVAVDIENGAGIVVGSGFVIGQTFEVLPSGSTNTIKLLMPTVTPLAGYKIVAKDGSAAITVVSTLETGLKTNSLGDLYGSFHIDAGTWTTGNADVFVTDQVYPNHPVEMTNASATYTTKGVAVQSWDTFSTTYNTQVQTQALSASRTTGTTVSTATTQTSAGSTSSVVSNVNPNPPAPPPVRSDPLAQSFYVNEVSGCFLTSLTLYFFYVESQYPVFVEVRDMINGYPGPNILAGGSTYVEGSKIQASQSKLIPTTFTFNNPVYVQGQTDYCFVIRTESNQTQVWTSKVGDKRIDSPAYVVEQPSLGSMFKSQNNTTWVSDDWSDITYKLNKAKFDTTYEGESTFVNVKASWQRLEVNPFMIKNGKNTGLVFHPNHGHQVSDWVSIKNSTDAMFNGDFEILAVTPDQYEIKVSDTNLVVPTGVIRVGGSVAEASENKTANILQFSGRTFVPTGAEMHFKYDISSDRNMSGTFTPLSFNTDLFLELYHAEVLSDINEQKLNSGKPSVALKAFMNSSNPDVSPVLDLGSLSVTAVNYSVNNPDSSYEWDFTENEVLTSKTLTFSTSAKTFSTTDTNLFDEFQQFEIGKSIKIIVGSTTYPTYVTNVMTDGTTYTVTYNGFTEEVTPVEITLNGTQTATVKQNDNYVREISPESGSSNFKYVSRVLAFNFDASAFKLWFDYIKPQYSDIDLYYKVSGDDAADLVKRPWVKYVPENKNVLIDTFVAMENEWTIEVGQPFKKMMFKIVLNSADQAYTPLLRNLRMIALA